jgi:hypothetical protein
LRRLSPTARFSPKSGPSSERETGMTLASEARVRGALVLRSASRCRLKSRHPRRCCSRFFPRCCSRFFRLRQTRTSAITPAEIRQPLRGASPRTCPPTNSSSGRAHPNIRRERRRGERCHCRRAPVAFRWRRRSKDSSGKIGQIENQMIWAPETVLDEPGWYSWFIDPDHIGFHVCHPKETINGIASYGVLTVASYDRGSKIAAPMGINDGGVHIPATSYVWECFSRCAQS